MATLKGRQKQVNLAFLRPDDIDLYERLEAMAYDRRYPLPTFILLALQEAFRKPDTTAADPPAQPE